MRWLLFLLFVLARPANADPETPRLTAPEIDQEDQARLSADQKRLDDERWQLQHEQAQAERDKALAELRASEYEVERAARTHRRHIGYGFGVAAVVFGGLAITAGVLGKNTNSKIEKGGLGKPGDITYEADTGQIYNYVAYGTGLVAGLAFVIATPLIALDLDRGDLQVAPIAGNGASGLAVSGSF